MKACVSKTFRFEASHHLPNHDGKCRRPHGHSYRVVITCEGPIILKQVNHAKHGMVVDFTDLKNYWKEQVEPFLDHHDLNESLANLVPETTAECIGTWICAKFDAVFPVKQVELWETETSCAVIDANEMRLNGGDLIATKIEHTYSRAEARRRAAKLTPAETAGS